jgi:hypothetical protein
MRQLLGEAAIGLAGRADGNCGNWKDLTRAALGHVPGPLVSRVARSTIGNMVRTAELLVVDEAHRLAVYAPGPALQSRSRPDGRP